MERSNKYLNSDRPAPFAAPETAPSAVRPVSPMPSHNNTWPETLSAIDGYSLLSPEMIGV